jgi:hypothetical protein
MRPRPRFRQVRQLVLRLRRPLDFEHRQQFWVGAQSDALLFPHDHEAEPGAQLARFVGLRRCEEPGKVRAVKFNCGKVVRLEVSRQMARLRSDHLLRINAGDIARAVKVHLPAYVNAVVHPQVDRHRNNAELPLTQFVGRLNAGCRSLPHPRQEYIIR